MQTVIELFGLYAVSLLPVEVGPTDRAGKQRIAGGAFGSESSNEVAGLLVCPGVWMAWILCFQRGGVAVAELFAILEGNSLLWAISASVMFWSSSE